MIDYNFFESFEVKKKKRNLSMKIAMTMYVLIFLAIAGVIGRNYMVIGEKQIQLDDLTLQLNEIKVDESISRILEKQRLNNELLAIVSNLDTAQETLENNGHVNENMIAIVVDAMPMDVQLSGFSIGNLNISASGSAGSKPAIAEFEYNLRNMSIVQNVLIGGIARSEETFTFDISITLNQGGVENDN